MSVTSQHYREILESILQARLRKNARYSIRSFARSLDLDSSALAQIIKGQRIPSHAVANKIIQRLALDETEARLFLASLAKTQASRSLKRKNQFLRKYVVKPEVESLVSYQALNHEEFSAICEWYHYAILELTLTRGFKSSPQWIASQLGI